MVVVTRRIIEIDRLLVISRVDSIWVDDGFETIGQFRLGSWHCSKGEAYRQET